MSNELVKLNLGGGTETIDGFKNIDLFSPLADEKVDLYQFPWKWETSSVDAVAVFHFLEHVPDLDRTLHEINRILKPGGLIWIKVPHGRGWTAHCMGHRHFFTWFTFKTMTSDSYAHQPPQRLFEETSYHVRFLKGSVNWTPFDCIASLIPRFWEQFIPIYPIEIEWKGIAVKGGS
jgi:predicted SAM-dependent methyltransferase